jgi:tetratricopeptide (TPR) repeat protein
MNFFQKILTFFPSMYIYLKGVRFFNERNYSDAIQKFDKCLKHPKFQNDQLFSYYGQALCAVGRLEESHKHLMKACGPYKNEGWITTDTQIC